MQLHGQLNGYIRSRAYYRAVCIAPTTLTPKVALPAKFRSEGCRKYYIMCRFPRCVCVPSASCTPRTACSSSTHTHRFRLGRPSPEPLITLDIHAEWFCLLPRWCWRRTAVWKLAGSRCHGKSAAQAGTAGQARLEGRSTSG